MEAAATAIRRVGPGISMADIAAEAGVTKPVLYRHFTDKGDLYATLADRWVSELVAAMAPSLDGLTDPFERIQVTISVYLERIDADRAMHDFLTHRAASEQPEAAHVLQHVVHQLGDRIAGIVASELERSGLSSAGAAPIAHGMIGMVQAAGDWWLADQSMSRDDVAAHLTQVLWHGLPGMDRATVRTR